MVKRGLRVPLIVMLIVSQTMILHARKTGYRHSSRETKSDKEVEMISGSFMVASDCKTCNNGYEMDMLRFSGYDKKRTSKKESFFITNETDRTVTGITLYIEYLTPEGKQLHKKFMKLDCNIPAGETRKAEIPSWDTQNSFYYLKSETAPKSGSPYEVIIDPVAFYLRY